MSDRGTTMTRLPLVIAGAVIWPLATLAGCGAEAEPVADARPSPPAAADRAAAPVPTLQRTEAAPPPHVPRLVDASGDHAHTNRLIDQTSPYLLQHAHNPVDWHPWGEEAFETARRRDVPIFLSIGYSTCYWCHVMERESFEDEEVAAYLNEHFVAIKVDREERPDVDDIYMAAVQTLTGRGGWPMSLFLEPTSLMPFFGGTYFPKEGGGARPGFRTLLVTIDKQWQYERQSALDRARQTAQQVERRLRAQTIPVPLGAGHVDGAVARFMASYDGQNGGFRRGAPKFPVPTTLRLMIEAGWDDPSVRNAVTHTLDRMAMGGMYDQVGGGFHRYSTDARWLVPHFEKMLYDNGQLAAVYAEAYARTGKRFYAQVVRETLDYVLREMTGPEGRLYSAQDAESESREGRSYIWTPAEIRSALDDAGLADEVDFTLTLYGLNRGPNFRDPHHPGEGRKNVLFLANEPAIFARVFDMSEEAFDERVARVDAALLRARAGRVQPITDDKTLAGWSGLMIAGLADGGRVLGEERYLVAARRAADFVLVRMRTPDGGLYRSYRAGKAKTDAFLEDYAFFVHGLLALHRATGDPRLVQEALDLVRAARPRFHDDDGGGYFDTRADQADLFVRTKAFRDSVVPCGNSIMLHDLLDLHELTGDPRLLTDAAETLGALSTWVRSRATSGAISVLALARFVDAYAGYLPTTRAALPAPPLPVVVSVSSGSLVVTPDTPADLEVTLAIGRGYHVNAHDPRGPGLVGLSVTLVGSGVEARVTYPEGEPYASPLDGSTTRVHTGTVTLPVRVTRTGPVTGRPRLVLTYQVCTDRLCLAPNEDVLPVEIMGQ